LLFGMSSVRGPRFVGDDASRVGRVPPPDPGGATTVDEIVERLRALKAWAGNLSYERITGRVNGSWASAGRPGSESVGRTTVVDCFRPGRLRLSSDLVVAIVRALHPDPGYVAQWHQALRVVAGEQRAAAQVRVHDSLPPDLPGFVGRAADLRRLRRALTGGGPAIGAIEGMAGVGKTRLALRAAHQLHRAHPYEKVLFVNLRGFHPDPAQPPADPAAVLDGFLRLLGVPGPKIPHDLTARARLYRDRLATVRALVVLDNAAGADQVRPLLPGPAGGPVLITSRRSLAALRPAAGRPVDVFSIEEALLFLTRESGGVTDTASATRIAELCGRLPLALGLVTAHIRAKPDWSLADHADRLHAYRRERRLDDLVELALDLSYQNIGEWEQRLLRLLALHPAEDFDAYAAAALTGTDLDTARAGLHRLSADHLVQPVGGDRHSMHDLIRMHATVRADDEERPADRRAALTRLFDHYLATAAAAMDTLHPGEAYRRPQAPVADLPAPDLTTPDAAVTWLDAEHDTLVAIAAHAADNGWPTHAIRLSRTLFRHLSGNNNREAAAIYGHAYRAAQLAGDPHALAHALCDLGVALWRLGQAGAAIDHSTRAVRLFRRSGDAFGQARAHLNLGNVESQLSHYPAAADHYSRAVALFGEAGDRLAVARGLSNLGYVHRAVGRFDLAVDQVNRALAITRELGQQESVAHSLNTLGHTEIQAGHLEAARAYFDEALGLFRQLGSGYGEANVLDGLGLLHTRLGEPEVAIGHHEQALAVTRRHGERNGEVWALNSLGEATRAAGRLPEALTHHSAALAVAIELGARDQQARAHAGLGDVHDRRGDPAASREHLEQAERLYLELGMPEADAIRGRLAQDEPFGNGRVSRTAPARRRT
jgi:tetratricopeptide (TPR) repeat protein